MALRQQTLFSLRHTPCGLPEQHTIDLRSHTAGSSVDLADQQPRAWVDLNPLRALRVAAFRLIDSQSETPLLAGSSTGASRLCACQTVGNS